LASYYLPPKPCSRGSYLAAPAVAMRALAPPTPGMKPVLLQETAAPAAAADASAGSSAIPDAAANAAVAAKSGGLLSRLATSLMVVLPRGHAQPGEAMVEFGLLGPLRVRSDARRIPTVRMRGLHQWMLAGDLAPAVPLPPAPSPAGEIPLSQP